MAFVAFVPLAMPIMFGPGGIATILGMTTLIEHSEFEVVSFFAVGAAMVATMGMDLIFHGLVEALHSHGFLAARSG